MDEIEIQNEFALGKRRSHEIGMALSSSLCKAEVSFKKSVCLCMPGCQRTTPSCPSLPFRRAYPSGLGGLLQRQNQQDVPMSIYADV